LTHKVLVLDDSKFSRNLITIPLKRLDLEIIESDNPFGALQTIINDPPSLIITDLKMPSLEDGLDFLAVLGRRFADIPVIVVSAEAAHNQDVKERGLKHLHFLPKPVRPELLIPSVRRILRPDLKPEVSDS
jgi:two-component system nitrogen regulation response regulator GlnG